MSWGGARLILAACAASAIGCAAQAPVARGPVVTAPAAKDVREVVRELREGIDRALRTIACVDPRFARRLPLPAVGVDPDARPTEGDLRAAAVKALAAGDADVSIHDGALDFFSFTARGRALDAAARTVDGLPEPMEDSAVDGAVSGRSIARPKLERELAIRLVAEERARLEEERSLPRGASALVRGVVQTWAPPESSQAAAERDEWLAQRLDQIRASLPGSALSRGALLELDDSLDPLERLALPAELPSSARELARLRVFIGDTPAAPAGTDAARVGRIEAAVKAHLGLSLDAREIRARLETAEKQTRALAKEAVTPADERAVARGAEELQLSVGRCAMGEPATASPLRALEPSTERAAICNLLHALRDVHDDRARAAALVALHDATVVALWALALHADGASPERAVASAHPFFGAQPEREARLVRFAEARPVAAIGAGLAAELLTRERARRASATAADLRATSKRWLTFGDAPLDVVEREVFASVGAPASPVSSGGSVTSSPAPASPRP